MNRLKKFTNELTKPLIELKDGYIGERGNIYRSLSFVNVPGPKVNYLTLQKIPIFYDEYNVATVGPLSHISIPRLVYKYFNGIINQDERIWYKDGNPRNFHYSNLEKISLKEYNDRVNKSSDWKDILTEIERAQINLQTGEVRQYNKPVKLKMENVFSPIFIPLYCYDKKLSPFGNEYITKMEKDFVITNILDSLGLSSTGVNRLLKLIRAKLHNKKVFGIT